MRAFWRVVKAEFYKQYRSYWTSRTVIVSMLVWPIIQFAAAYYMYRPFGSLAGFIGFGPSDSPQSLALFLLTGYLGYNLFYQMVQTAWQLTLVERRQGTLELLFLTPAHRFALLLGTCAGGVLRLLYLLGAFALGMFVFYGGTSIRHPLMLLLLLPALVIPALAWGTVLISVVLFARDSSAFVNVSGAPLNFLSGVRVPVLLYPGWLQALGAMLPLTWSLRIVRAILLQGAGLRDIQVDMVAVTALSVACFVLAKHLMNRGETLTKQKGTLILY